MTAYEFIKARVKRNNLVYSDWYRPSHLEKVLIDSNKGKDLRRQREYHDAQDAFIDVTMSCDLEEAIGSLEFFREKAVAYGLETKDKNWGYFFLAAYDLERRLRGAFVKEV